MPIYAAPLPAITAAATWSQARSGEDEGDVDRARSSAKCARWRWGLSVSDLTRALARVRRKRRSPGGLAGLDLLLGQILAARSFSFENSFSFSKFIFWIDFDMNSNPFEFKLLWEFLQGSVGSNIVKKPCGYLARAWSSLGFKSNRDFALV